MYTPTITIIGLGNVGTALLHALTDAGYGVHSVFSRSEIDDKWKESFSQTIFYSSLPASGTECGELIFLSVKDEAIESVSNQLCKAIDLKGKTLVHCSGTYVSDILMPAKKEGAFTASMHPLKAVTKSSRTFADSWFDVEGDENAVLLLEQIVARLNAKCLPISADAKPYLHASAVVASNYIVVLAELVSRISSEADLDKRTIIEALMPLMRSTLSNIEELGPADALTGPVARGDAATIAKHLELLKNNSQVLYLYKQLGLVAADLAERQSLGTEAANKIRKLFNDEEKKP